MTRWRSRQGATFQLGITMKGSFRRCAQNQVDHAEVRWSLKPRASRCRGLRAKSSREQASLFLSAWSPFSWVPFMGVWPSVSCSPMSQACYGLNVCDPNTPTLIQDDSIRRQDLWGIIRLCSWSLHEWDLLLYLKKKKKKLGIKESSLGQVK